VAVAPAADDSPWLTPANVQSFHQICRERALHAVFQPILDFQAREFVAHEGLIRGPADTPLASPAALFALARELGVVVEFERMCREIVIRSFAELGLPGRLFINASIAALGDPQFLGSQTFRLLESLGMRTGQIVIELIENQRADDFAALRELLDAYRGAGYQIAVDDLGEGFANLRIWSEVRPDFVKIDRHFISGIADDNLKFQLVRAMHEIAETSHVHLIAEGIETEAEFATVCDLGIAYGQGFLIACPTPAPRPTPTESVLALIKRGSIIVYPRAAPPTIAVATARKLLMAIEPVAPSCLNKEVFARFEQDPSLVVLPVVDTDGRPLGLINRYSLIDRFARPFRHELFGKRPCTQFMDPLPIVVDHATSIQDLGHRLSQSAQHQLLDGFIITEGGRYIGIGSSQSLMAVITDMQIRAARYANPLTQLPGNVPINEHIERLLARAAPFAACYCDIDSFKPYNDTYGYRRGDQLIQFLGALLAEVADPRLDFVGHIGGDDFILLLQSPDWQRRLSVILELFDEGMKDFTDPEHRQLGGYSGEDRKGRPVFHSLPTLSIGCLPVEGGGYHSHHEVSSALTESKRQAKKIAGNSLFIERRRLHGDT
jgi:EAL domain-containing protein (putative c-di-GMP-specific phosphodiesterase class I)/GGDEF domain-containing protein